VLAVIVAAPLLGIFLAALGGRRFRRVRWIWPLGILGGYVASFTLISIAYAAGPHTYCSN
jgi:hypothetical protein